MNIEIKNLIEEVKLAADCYYQGKEPIMTDNEYDTKTDYLKDLIDSGELELTDELQEILYDSVSAGSTPKGIIVQHDYPMLSLGKAKNADELNTYHKRLTTSGAKGFRLEMKFDGLALSAKYASGKLIQLATRGDGITGESLNHLINNKYVSMIGLPLSVNSKEDFELRGELYITDPQFVKINKARKNATGETFSNSRNAVSGMVKRAEREMAYNAEITFTAYSAYKDGEQIGFTSLGDITGILTAKDVTEAEIKKVSTASLTLKSAVVNSVSFDKLMEAVATFGQLRETFTIPTDGVVIKPTNEIEMLVKMGSTSHHPIAYIAYKYPGEKASSEILDIVISVGKTGKLTPKAIITPVEVGGVVVSNVTCHNFSWLKEKGIKVGAKVLVTRANDVIPAIDSVIIPGNGPEIEIPTVCPKCNGKLEGKGDVDPTSKLHKTLSCVNETCPSRSLFYIKSIVGRTFLDIDGLGDVALNALVEQEIINGIVDLYTIKEEILANIVTGVTSTGGQRNLGAGNAKNIMASIQNSKENTESFKLLAALNIPGLGKSHSKKLIEKFGGIEKVLNLKPNQLYEIDGIGDSVVNAYVKYRDNALETFNQLVALGFKVNDPIKKENNEKKGTFSVSGSVEGFNNRDEFVEHMESIGWEFHKSPKKDTDVLFADPNGTSSKIKKAIANGTRIIDKLEDL